MYGNIAILGSGSWGTALAIVLGKKGLNVRLWSAFPEETAAIRRDRENARYLPGAPVPNTVIPHESIVQAVDGVDAVVVAVPSSALREVVSKLRDLIDPGALLIQAGKGLENTTGLRGSQIIAEELGPEIGANCVALSGPNLAIELANDVPTATVVAGSNPERTAAAQDLFASQSLRVYRNSDIVGVELGGALKNVFAVGAGISDGLGYGDNTKATLVTRGLVEMTRLGVALGADPKTFMGLSGLGDLMATCASSLSRNLRIGRMVGQGITVDESRRLLGQVAEGVPTCEAAYRISRNLGIDTPIIEQIHAVLFHNKPPKQAVLELMTRDSKAELS